MERREARPPSAREIAETLAASLGYECDDCGLTYGPGASLSPCADEGHNLRELYADEWFPVIPTAESETEQP